MKKVALFFLMINHLLSAPQLPEKLKNFLNSNTEEAKELLQKMTDEELLEYYNLYLQEKSTQERRYLWLIEEYLERKAEEAAKERLIYLFLAVILLLLAIWLYAFLTYRRYAKAKL